MILPGKTIGILGGGQLGKMTAQAAHTLGYRVHIYDASGDAPAFGLAHARTVGAFDDGAALARFAAQCDVVTYEFENLGSSQLAVLEGARILRPSASVLSICQNRLREKTWLRDNGFPHAAFMQVASADDLATAVAHFGYPCVLKTADFGYDGKGQLKLKSAQDLPAAERSIVSGGAWVVEQWVPFEKELSVIVARGPLGETAVYPVFENVHRNHILDVTVFPGRVESRVAEAARLLAVSVAERIGLVGILAVELFMHADGTLVVNEMAPRPHNSGHATIEGARTSQFEQHVRSVCGLPLGDTRPSSAASAMVNLLGDVWAAGTPPWHRVLAEPGAHLHLYGKLDPRPGRKMGHITVTDTSADRAVARARALRQVLSGGGE
jgi:5-(carboxyamino)imidazole ribonucleotide synthase